MGLFILRRLGVMILTALCLTFIVFFLTNLYPNLEKLAKTQGNFRMSDEAVASWLGNRGYLQPTADANTANGWVSCPAGRTQTEDGVETGRCFGSDVPAEDRATLLRHPARAIGAIPRCSRMTCPRSLQRGWA